MSHICSNANQVSTPEGHYLALQCSAWLLSGALKACSNCSSSAVSARFPTWNTWAHPHAVAMAGCSWLQLVAAGCSWLQLGLTPPFPSVPSAIPWSPVLHPPWHQISSVDCVESESVDCWVLETEIGCMLHSNVQLYSKVAAKKNYGGAGYRWIHHSISYVDQSCSCRYKGQISRQLYIHCLRRHIVCWLFGTAAYSCNIDDQDIDQNSPSCVKHRNKATRWVLGSQVLLVGRNIGIISCLAFELTPGINAWLGSADTRDKCCSLGASVSNTRDERCDDNL